MASGAQPPPLPIRMGEGVISTLQPFVPPQQLLNPSSSTKPALIPKPLNHLHPHEEGSIVIPNSPNHPSFILKQPEGMNHIQSKQSYVEVLKGCSSNGAADSMGLKSSQALDLESMVFKPTSWYQGKPAVVFPFSEKQALVDKLKFVLVGKFSHGMPSLVKTRKFFISLKLFGFCNVSMFDKKHIFIECSCQADYNYIWMQLSWAIEGFVMRVFKWTADFHPVKESAVVPAWIRLEGLPLYMFDERSLMSIANTIGKPLKVDPRNVARTMVNSAWICVELDLTKPLVDSLWINFEDDISKEVREGFWAKVFYDVVPQFCYFCSHIGHSADRCKRKMEQSSAMAAMRVNAVEQNNMQDRHDLLVPSCSQTVGLLGSGVVMLDNTFSKIKAQHEIAGHLCAAKGLILGKNCTMDKTPQGHIRTAADDSLLGNLEGSIHNGFGQEQQVILGAADGLTTACTKSGAQQGKISADMVMLDHIIGHGEGDGDGTNDRETRSIQQLEGMLAKKYLISEAICNFQLDKESLTADDGNSMCKQAGGVTKPTLDHAEKPTIGNTAEISAGVLMGGETAAGICQRTAAAMLLSAAGECAAGETISSMETFAGVPRSAAQAVEHEECTKDEIHAFIIPQQVDEIKPKEGANEPPAEQCEEITNLANESAADQVQGLNLVSSDSNNNGWAAFVERMHRLQGHKPERNVERPTEVVKVFDTRLPVNFDPEYSDKDGSTVTWSQLMSRSLKVLTARSLSPVARSSKKKSKLRKRVEYIKYEEGAALVIEKENYKELVEIHNANLLQRVSAFKDQRKASSTKESTEKVSKEMIADASNMDDWTPAPRKGRRGRNRNRNKNSY